MSDRIILCDRKARTHLRLTITDAYLLAETGSLKSGVFDPIGYEQLPFAEFPELLCLHDGCGWNLVELANFVSEWKAPSRDEVQVVLSRTDLDLLTAAGLELVS